MNRKEFLYNSSILFGATLLGCNPSAKKNGTDEIQSFNFDLHTHPGTFFNKGSEDYAGDEAFIQRVREMKVKGISGAFFCLVADWPLLELTDKGVITNGSFSGEEGWKVFQDQLTILKDLISRSEAKLAFTGDELHQGDQVKAYLACEGGDFLVGNLERVEVAYQEGLRSIQLVHYAPNDLGDLQTWESQHGGLSDFGKKVVRKMNELGMIIDLAHASAETVKHAADITDSPILLSHSILNVGKDSPVSARTISIEHAKMIANTGGLIGLWPSGYSDSLDEFVEQTLRLVDVVGVDHVGIGTDMDANYKPVISNYEEFIDCRKALASKGLSPEDIHKIAGGNAQRILKEVL